ncbi:latexin isoform X1 [Platichthys flesus]|uniref:latexin isoform X1 n=2 Tax=Platichthys flesus TaxID=8260 RepID=UPI002DB96DEB|nr:latexin isoform X1 [Platichthys flesus]
MGLTIIVFLALLMGVTGSPNVTIRPEASTADNGLAHSTSFPETSEEMEIAGQQNVSVPEEAFEDVMATGELNPNHYPAQRAAKAVQHYLNTLYGSPYRVIFLNRVHSGYAEDVADSGRKYKLEITVQDYISNKTENCTAEVLFPGGEQQRPPQVQALLEELPTTDTKAEEEALFQKYKTNQGQLSEHLPDSHGHVDPEMEPFKNLGHAASSFIMLNESTENTLYNVAQVANVTQLKTENDQLKFDYYVLLHDMISQEIIHWKLLFTWSPQEGVKVLQMEKLPHSHHEEIPQNNN